MIDIAALRVLLAEAAPGPWRNGANGSHVFDSDNEHIAQTWVPSIHDGDACRASAALICAAVNALPELLAIAESAEKYATVTRVDRYTDGCVDRHIAAQLDLYAAVDAARGAK